MNLSKANEFAIIKWNWIVANNGVSDISSMISKIPELGVLKSKCGFCDMYWLHKDANSQCKDCPMLIDKTDLTSNCKSTHHPYNIWLNDKTLINAKRMLKYVRLKILLIK